VIHVIGWLVSKFVSYKFILTFYYLLVPSTSELSCQSSFCHRFPFTCHRPLQVGNSHHLITDSVLTSPLFYNWPDLN